MQALTKYRPTKAPDDTGGGFTRSYSDGVTVYGMTTFDEPEIRLVFGSSQDIVAGDVIESDEGNQYEVTNVRSAMGAMDSVAILEKTEKPIG